MKCVITGATGFIGQAAILELVREGHQLTALVRNPESASAKDLPCKAHLWIPGKTPINELSEMLKGVDAIIHLAGEPIAARRWSKPVKKRILDSRVVGTRQIVEALALLSPETRPKTMLCASAIGLYGDRGDEVLTELSASGDGFLADVTAQWEAQTLEAERLGVRVVLLRTGVVLGQGGGALEKMQPVVLGSGHQWMSWIHLEDEVRFFSYALTNEIRGAFNLVSPEPVTNKDFTKAYARAIGVPSMLFPILKTPASILRVALGEMSQLLLASQKVMPERTLGCGFTFLYPTLDSALAEIYSVDNPNEEKFSASQFVARPLSEVFEFFSEAKNLEELTPPWLDFHILKVSTLQIQDQTEIDYRLRIHGLPLHWRSRIERWAPGHEFMDTQLKGPYSKWHHTHRFEEVPGGTLVHDDVEYQIPGGLLGKAALGYFVRRDINRIFSYRRNKVAEIFKR